MASITVIPFKFFEAFEVGKNNQPRARALRYNLNALADFEQEVGMGFGQLMMMKASFATTRAMAWAGLKHQDRALTLERVGDLIQEFIHGGGDMNEVLTACVEAAVDQGALGRPNKPEATETAPALPAASGPVAVPDVPVQTLEPTNSTPQ